MKILTIHPRGADRPIHINADYVERIVPGPDGCSVYIHRKDKAYAVTDKEADLLYMLRQT